ncbi:hypothetical protein TCAL_09131 [Tigriopus californicus]|uniref:BTB domain-containing protein n=1 Tax=Tigriopus californicus TaxID=6832 RepID=A0A553N6H0_TIGCA|nr:uncharacterized protein LOC131885718 [Tigriopus californicus]XP_059089838.1 uncharacterized protein LOC131885718 [Tigriopus californicus]TRY61028.1 hypothetical protein TCAL_09131 [Tigriopus californicus]|eukprot:TCALIF_09131-PA protein Name:"Protein of unknown function" AED:0.00 eAED:0.00 QI:193/1/1/1/1/1/5/8/440
MGSLQEETQIGDMSEDDGEVDQEPEKSSEPWVYGSGADTWQAKAKSGLERTSKLHNSREMSDLCILACDENWWFGDTVKDFTAHKLLLGAASPVLYQVLYELDEVTNPDRRLVLEPRLQVTLALVQCYDYVRLDIDGIPPIAMEALLNYIYKDQFNSSDFENGYSRNLLWRLWHTSKAFEMDHLTTLCAQTIHQTMCDDTVFWDLNYAMQYKELGTEEVMEKVIKMVDEMNEKVFENPNFVWLDKAAIHEVLQRRKPGNCDAMVVYNNLLRWVLYQVDRTACAEVGDQQGSQIPIIHRLEWITECKKGFHDHVSKADLEKYLHRGLAQMHWTELSQKDFLEFVVPYPVLEDEELLRQSIILMEIVVQHPERLNRSAFQLESNNRNNIPGCGSKSQMSSPSMARRLSRTNSLRKSINDVKLRKLPSSSGSRSSSRPTSMIS